MSIESVSILQRFSWIINLIFHQGVAVITVYILNVILTSYNVSELFTWHAILCTLGFMFLAMEGLILWNDSNIPTLFIPKSNKLIFHIIFLGSSTVCVILGIAIEISKKSSHFTTSHGILGLITLMLLIVEVFLGIFASLAKHFKHHLRPVIPRLLHNCIGVTTIVFGITTLCLGLLKKSFQNVTNDSTATAAIIFMYLLVLWACIGALKSMYHQIKSLCS